MIEIDLGVEGLFADGDDQRTGGGDLFREPAGGQFGREFIEDMCSVSEACRSRAIPIMKILYNPSE